MMPYKHGWEAAELLRLLYRLKLIDFKTLDDSINKIQVRTFEYELEHSES